MAGQRSVSWYTDKHSSYGDGYDACLVVQGAAYSLINPGVLCDVKHIMLTPKPFIKN